MKADLHQKTLLALVSVLVCLVVAEVAARLALVHLADDWRFLRYASSTQLESRYGPASEAGAEKFTYPRFLAAYSLHRYLGYAPTPDYERGANRHNSLGFRGGEIALPKPAGAFYIACLGSSTTYTTEIEDWRLAYPALLERAVAEESGASLFDFGSRFPQDRRLFTDGRHMTEEGSRLKATMFAQHLIDSGLLPLQPQ